MRSRLLVSLVMSSWSVSWLTAQEGVPAPAGLVPEQMWYAPTAEDWKKPVAIR